ncbi:AAA family ATPase, partial [bacterium]|nr:AAA family ATPase [bacterium]
DETRWTISDWLPEASCGLIVAPPGSYKTWILTALAYAVATGKPFLNHYSVINKGPVLFIQQEDPWWMLQSRLARMPGGQPPTESGKGNNKVYTLDCRSEQELDEMPLYWYTAREFNFASKDALAGMEQKIIELQPKLVMIDPLYAATDTKDYMAESAQKMLTLKIMRDKYGCSFALAHHTTVSGSKSEGRETIWGSAFLNAWLEWGWRVPEGDDKGNMVIRHFKGSEDPKRIRVKFNITDFSFDVDIDEKPAESISERIEEMILNGGGIKSVRGIAEKIGCGKSTVQRIMKKINVKEGKE